MGLVRLPCVQGLIILEIIKMCLDYWSKEEIFKNRIGELSIGYERYCLLNKFFQIEDR